MKPSIQKLATSIITTTREIGKEAERLPADAGIVGAECVIHLRDAQRCLRAAHDAMRLAIGQQQDLPKNDQVSIFDEVDAA